MKLSTSDNEQKLPIVSKTSPSKNSEIEKEKKKSENSAISHKKDTSSLELNNKSNEESQSEDSVVSFNATCSSGCFSGGSFYSTQMINIKLYYFINNNIKDIEILITEDKTIKDLIYFSLNIINEQLISEKLNIQLDISNNHQYCIKAVKNIEDLNNNTPSINLDILLVDCNLDYKYFLIWLDKNNSNILPYKRINNNVRESKQIENYHKNKNSFDNNNNIKQESNDNLKIKNNNSQRHNKKNKIENEEDNNCLIY